MQSEIDHHRRVTQETDVDPARAGDGGGHAGHGTRTMIATLVAIREHDRRRRDFHQEEKSLTLRMRAICRRIVSGRLKAAGVNLSDVSGLKDVRTSGGELFERVEKQWRAHLQACKRQDKPFSWFDVRLALEGDDEAGHACELTAHFMAARDVMEHERKAHEKELRLLARQLPVWPWAESIRGLSDLSLAQLVSEAVDPGRYPTVAKLWKRMGVGLVGGERQHRTTDAAKALAMGYSPARRSVVFVVGENLVKQNDGVYRQLYDDRKVYEREKAAERGQQVVPAAKIPKKNREAYMSDGHVHARSKRYMEKRLLRDLWVEWRRGLIHTETLSRGAAPPLDS